MIDPFRKKKALAVLLVFLFFSCKAPQIEDVEMYTGKKNKYFPSGTIESANFKKFLNSVPVLDQSYTASFKISVQSFHPEKKSFTAKGRILFNSDFKKIKIQLMDQFFGLIFSQIIATDGNIRIKGYDNVIHSQLMDDIALLDPGSGKQIIIPFKVIYEFLTQEYIRTVNQPGNYYNFAEKRILVKKNTDKLYFSFNQTELESIELISEQKNIMAIAKVTKRGKFLPLEITTKVRELNGSGNEKDLVRITLNNLEIGKVVPSAKLEF